MTRQRLIDAACRIMASKDLEEATIAEIAAEADVGFGSFYNHFGSKQEILDAIYSAYLSGFLSIARTIVAGEAYIPRSMSHLARLVLRKAATDPVWARYLVKELSSLEDTGSDFFDLFRTQLALGARLGQLHIPNLHRTVRALFACLHGAVREVLSNGDDTEDIEEESAELLLRMLGISLKEAETLARAPLPQLAQQAAELPGSD